MPNPIKRTIKKKKTDKPTSRKKKNSHEKKRPENSTDTAHELTITGNPNNLLRIRDFIGNAAQKAGVSEALNDDIVISVDEACSNILEHNYKKLRHKKKLTVRWEVKGKKRKRFEIIITDEGTPFDPTAHSHMNVRRHLKDMKSRGMGIYLISRLMSSVQHRYVNGSGNILTLIKYFK